MDQADRQFGILQLPEDYVFVWNHSARFTMFSKEKSLAAYGLLCLDLWAGNTAGIKATCVIRAMNIEKALTRHCFLKIINICVFNQKDARCDAPDALKRYSYNTSKNWLAMCGNQIKSPFNRTIRPVVPGSRIYYIDLGWNRVACLCAGSNTRITNASYNPSALIASSR